MGQEEVRTFLLYLAQERKITAGSQKASPSDQVPLLQHVEPPGGGLENIPTPKLPVQLPVVLSREEVLAIFEAIPYIKHKAMVATTYGVGLRISRGLCPAQERHRQPTDAHLRSLGQREKTVSVVEPHGPRASTGVLPEGPPQG